MKLTNLETYLFIIEHMPEEDIEALCLSHSKERISISVLKYLIKRNKILKACKGKKPITIVADIEGITTSKIYRAINSYKKHKK